MKYLYIGILILGFLICLCYFSGRQIDLRAKTVLEPLQKAMAADRAGNDLLRDTSVSRAIHVWQETMPLLSCLLSHTHTEEVTVGLSELRLLSGTEFQRCCSKLVSRLSAIAEMDQPRLGNIF